MLKRYVGDRAFYRRVLSVALPIIFQNAITNFVSLLDNVMVGQLSTAQIAGVTIVNNNLLFVVTLCLYGGVAGAGIFTNQYYGCQNHEGIAQTFRYKLLVSLLLGGLAITLFSLADRFLIGLYLKGDGDPALAADTMRYGRQYLKIMLIGLLPFALTNAYSSILRECGHPAVPMAAGFAAMGVNILLNYVLIFGHFGAPAMGVAGAAVATVVSRFAELGIVVIWAHTHPKKLPCIRLLFRSLRIPLPLLRGILKRGAPILLNECLFSLGLAVLNQCYSVRGLTVVPALSISTTVYDLGSVAFRSLGNAVGILTGQMLGANLPKKEIFETNRKMNALCVSAGIVFGILVICVSGVVPKIYNTDDSVRQLATMFIIISALFMPMQGYIFPAYFTMCAGGKTLATLIFDCGINWVISIPLAWLLTRLTGLSIVPIFLLCNSVDILKAACWLRLVYKKKWIRNLTVLHK